MKLRKMAAIRLILTLAIPVMATAAQAQSGNPHAVSLYNLGLTAYKQGSPESAIIFFKRACDIDPDLADAQYNLGVIFQSQKRLKEAVPRFQEVLRIKPADPDAHYQLALCFIDLGQPQDARAQLAAIPPNDRHYGDAQKRIGLVDQQIATGAAAPVQGMPAASTPDLANPIASPNTGATQGQPAVTSYAQPVQAAVTPAPQYSGLQGAVQTTPATQPSATGPVAILSGCTVRVIATGFNAPAGLNFDRSGNLYVANFLSNSVDRIGQDGSKTQFSSGSNLKGPIGLVVDAMGNLYVANYVGGTVVRISPAGVSSVIAAGLRKPYYLTMDKDGNLFVSQQEDNSILRISLPRPIGAKPE